MQKKVSAVVYAVLLILCVAVLIYLAVFNHRTSEVVITTVPVTEAKPQTHQMQSDAGTQKGGMIDLNTADQAQLEILPGIGPGLAAQIIAYRESIGKFTSKEQVKDVDGIGDKRYEQIEQFITVGGAP